jgi:hypothetical protein
MEGIHGLHGINPWRMMTLTGGSAVVWVASHIPARFTAQHSFLNLHDVAEIELDLICPEY